MVIFNSFVAGLCFGSAVYEAIHYRPGKGGWIMVDFILCLINLWCAIVKYMG